VQSKVDGSIEPIIGPALDPDAERWAGATWVGQVDEEDLAGDRIKLVGGQGFANARLLVWRSEQPLGFIEVALADGAVMVNDVEAAIRQLPEIPPRSPLTEFPPISVVVCTRDRPDQLRHVLNSLRELEYPEFELLVVDNNPVSGLTPPVVASFAEDPVRLLEARSQGLSISRNVAVKAAKHDIIAFTDDDVVVDESWLENLAYGFSRDEGVACVCGMVPSAELATPAQSYFDRRVDWARSCHPAVYDVAAPPQDDRLFPLRVARYGTGANFAVRKGVVLELGGFDEGMGIGSPTGGGEDIDMFVRILLAGRLLVREPAAVVWHRHRRTAEELEAQIHNYGLGLGAWMTKLMLRPRTIAMVLRRLIPGVRHLRGVTVVDQSDTVDTDPQLLGLDRRELKGVLGGPLALARARFAGRKGEPLKTRSGTLMKAFRIHRNEKSSGSESNTAGMLSLAAISLGLVGSLGAVRTLPTVLLVIVVGAFMFGGPGSLALSWYAHLPTSVLVSLVPMVSLAICLLVVSGALMLGFYSPVVVLLGMTGVSAVGGLLRYGYLARHVAVKAP
jgi:glycosyltransferase involved in cell wall biosynthesis